MRSNNRFHQTESQAQTFLVAAFVAAVQAVPDSWKVFGGNAHSGIFHREDCLLVLLIGGNFDVPAGPGVFDGVVQQVRERLLNPVAIDTDL